MKKELNINSAILHIIDNVSGLERVSSTELDMDSDACYEFLEKHVKRLLQNDAAKNAVFLPHSNVYALTKSYISKDTSFKAYAHSVCGALSSIMMRNTEIPPADIIVSQFDLGMDKYLAIIKLNYKEFYTHESYGGALSNTSSGSGSGSGNGEDLQIIKKREMLPIGGRVEEACLIPYDPMVLRIIEKPYVADGENRNYFSEIFLQCDAELSKKEAATVINDITEDIIEEYYGGRYDLSAKVKIAILEQSIEEEGVISVENIASTVFFDNADAKTSYIESAREAGIKSDIDFGDKFVKRQFGSYKFKSSAGIEIKLPAELCDDPAIVEFIENEDKSITVMLKNMRKN